MNVLFWHKIQIRFIHDIPLIYIKEYVAEARIVSENAAAATLTCTHNAELGRRRDFSHNWVDTPGPSPPSPWCSAETPVSVCVTGGRANAAGHKSCLLIIRPRCLLPLWAPGSWLDVSLRDRLHSASGYGEQGHCRGENDNRSAHPTNVFFLPCLHTAAVCHVPFSGAVPTPRYAGDIANQHTEPYLMHNKVFIYDICLRLGRKLLRLRHKHQTPPSLIKKDYAWALANQDLSILSIQAFSYWRGQPARKSTLNPGVSSVCRRSVWWWQNTQNRRVGHENRLTWQRVGWEMKAS